jgi:hypothetical protein
VRRFPSPFVWQKICRMYCKSKSKSFPRRAAITAALEPSLLPPLIGLVCEYSPFGPFRKCCSRPPFRMLSPHAQVLRNLCRPPRCCAVGLSLEHTKLCTERANVAPIRVVHSDRYLFVGDARSRSILVYSLERNWAFVRAIGSEGKGAGQLMSRWECAFITIN